MWLVPEEERSVGSRHDSTWGMKKLIGVGEIDRRVNRKAKVT